MKVIKIGGGCLKDIETIEQILALIATRGQGNIVVLSALNGVTDTLIEGMSAALADEDKISDIIKGYFGHIINPVSKKYDDL